jgi:uncharacterized protein (DUF1697 family)
MPTNVAMPVLRVCFEKAGFKDVRTLLSSGNVVFQTRSTSERSLEKRIEAAISDRLGQEFMTFVRTQGALDSMLASDPYRSHGLSPDAKRVVTFLRDPPAARLRLPIELHGARVLCVRGREAFSAYVRTPHGPVFMDLIETTFGKQVTTRTWNTVAKVATDLKKPTGPAGLK